MESIHCVIVGIGINVNNTHFPKALSEKVTSLCARIPRESLRIKLLQALLRSFERWYLRILKEQPGQTFERWRDLSCTLRNLVEVNLGDEIARD